MLRTSSQSRRITASTLTLEIHLSRATAIFAPPDKLASSPSKIKSKQTKDPHVPIAQWLERWLLTKGRGGRLPQGIFFDIDDYVNSNTFMLYTKVKSKTSCENVRKNSYLL